MGIRLGKIKENLRVLAAACLYYSGLVRFARWWMRRSGQHLIILNYHRAIGGDLRRQLLYLRRHYRIMHLEETLEDFYQQKEKKQRRDPRVPLALTFDDGYYDNYTHGFALARELQVPFTIFLIPGYIESNEPFWWREGERLVRNAQVDELTIEGHTYHLRQLEERRVLAQIIHTRACSAQSVAERETFLADTRKALGVPSSAGEEEGARPLTWAQVHEMEESGLVSFGAHTMRHPILGYLADPSEVQEEVGECRRVLEQQLGHPVQTFAYPVGKPEHIGEVGLQAVREAGYRWALTTIEEINNLQTDPYLLRRLPGDLAQHWLVMASELVGLLGIVSRLRKKYRAWIRGFSRSRSTSTDSS
jgi:peptidoglycan/xylan/chitin deacetylase (PgdA/CDA1 family)